MARKFITEKEHALIASINREVIQRWVGQEVVYYPISREETAVHDVYGEAVEKQWLPPVRVNCLVAYDNPVVKSMDIGLDSEHTLDVYMHAAELVERNLVPREGDFLEFGQMFFEVSGVTEPHMVFGQINNQIMVKLSCVQAREGTFSAEAYSSHEVDDGSHPVTTPTSRNVRD